MVREPHRWQGGRVATEKADKPMTQSGCDASIKGAMRMIEFNILVSDGLPERSFET
jgi:hypothetical protein